MSVTLTPGRAEFVSTRLAFFIAGLITSSWAPLVPFAQARTGLDAGGLGLILLCLGGGAILGMPLSGALAARWGCRAVVTVSALAVAFLLPFLAVVTPWWLLGGVLLAFGLAMGVMDCTMNLQAVMVERSSGRVMMSGFHGLYSLGGVAGSGISSFLLILGMTPVWCALTASLASVGLLVLARPGLLPRQDSHDQDGGGPLFAIPHGMVLAIGAACFILFLTEGAVLDWSAVFMTRLDGVDAGRAGLAYAAFSITMTAGRLAGDRVVRSLGPIRVLVVGATLAAMGLGLALLSPHWLLALSGFALVGAGCSNLVPVLFSAIGKQRTMPEHLAVPAVSTLGYAGILAGPAGIGAIAHLTSLPIALALLAVALLAVAAGARKLPVYTNGQFH